MAKSTINEKVSAPSKAAPKSKSQPAVGKLGGGLSSMPGSKGKCHAVKTVASGAKTGSAMGKGGIIDGFTK